FQLLADVVEIIRPFARWNIESHDCAAESRPSHLHISLEVGREILPMPAFDRAEASGVLLE
ncbi:hypothetical protein ABTD22_20320, partial [Acinetobacter baumannii]